MPGHGGCWPTLDQELLLGAAILEGEAAAASWRDWNQRHIVDDIDGHSLHLLPPIYRNLQPIDPHAAELNRLRGTYRHTWYRNQEMMRQVLPLLQCLEKTDIQLIVLNDLALAGSCYDDFGCRPISEVHLLVHATDVVRTLEVMEQLGWRHGARSLHRWMRGRSSLDVWKPQSAQATLHWRAFDARTATEDEREAWIGSQPLRLGPVITASLSPSDQLVLTCGYGVRCSAVPRTQWVLDGAKLIRSQSLALNWEHVVETARSAHVSRPLLDALAYLQQRFHVEIPAHTLRSLSAITPSRFECTEYAIRTGHSTLGHRIALHWWRHTLQQGNEWQAARTLFQYLQEIWDLDRTWEVPLHALRVGVRQRRH